MSPYITYAMLYSNIFTGEQLAVVDKLLIIVLYGYFTSCIHNLHFLAYQEITLISLLLIYHYLKS